MRMPLAASSPNYRPAVVAKEEPRRGSAARVPSSTEDEPTFIEPRWPIALVLASFIGGRSIDGGGRVR